MREMVGGCCVCSDDRGWSENPLVYCDGQSCTVAVHQACYGIVTVPTGPWYCRKCESQERSVKVKCELCPSRYGALKRTDNSGWAHVVCALYIPEVRFGNVTTMEPIQLQLIPTERFNKVCYICEEKGKAANATVGACMQCNKAGCRQQFHVTCAQSLGLLCEEAGNYLDNVKYCGYCQYHYSKLKKGGNVKTIPPYKPVSSENHLSDSNSEKEAEGGGGAGGSSKPTASQQSITSSSSPTISTTAPSSNKRKISSNSNRTSSASSSSSSSSKTSTNPKLSTGSTSSSQQKPVHSSSSKTDKTKTSSSSGSGSVVNNNSNSISSGGNNNNNSSTNVRSAKSEDTLANFSETETKMDTKDSSDKLEVKEKSSKKRRNNSRTPTPVSNESVSAGTATPPVSTTPEKKSSVSDADKAKKTKVETTQSILTNQPIVALTSISTIKSISIPIPAATSTDATMTEAVSSPAQSSSTSSIIQSTGHQISQTVNSLVVSVPLASTNLSPHHQLLNNQASVVTPTPFHLVERNSAERTTPNNNVIAGGSSSQTNTISSLETGNGGLKIIFEKQDAVMTEVDMELEVSSQDNKRSGEKSEKSSRGKKRNSNNPNGLISQLSNASISSNSTSKRIHRGQLSTSCSPQPGAFAAISQSQIKDSPPSSPSSESQSSISQASSFRGRGKGKKSILQSSMGTEPSSPKEVKDVKLFQNGVTAPHMLGNQLNPNSNMAQKMSDHLNSELEAHSVFSPNDNSNVLGPQLHHRIIASARASSSASASSGGSGLSSMLGGGGGNIPQTLDQLLERQWEQGSQFLMEQAQHFDIASLLSCLHQLRAENLRLEEHVSSLLQRRDHLLAVNARLAIPLTGQPAAPQPPHPHIVNNIHPSVGASHPDVSRPARHNNVNPAYPVHAQSTSQHSSTGPIENGLPPDPSSYSHRSPVVGQPQPSPSVRW